jgi:hypothetical protein
MMHLLQICGHVVCVYGYFYMAHYLTMFMIIITSPLSSKLYAHNHSGELAYCVLICVLYVYTVYIAHSASFETSLSFSCHYVHVYVCRVHALILTASTILHHVSCCADNYRYPVDPAALSHTPDDTSLLRSFITALLDRDSVHRITAKAAKAHTWLTTLAPPLPGDEQLEQTHEVQVSAFDVESAITKVNHLVMISFIRHRLLQRLKAAREVIAQRELAAAAARQKKQCSCSSRSEMQHCAASCCGNSSTTALPPRAQSSVNSNNSSSSNTSSSSTGSDNLSNNVPAKRVSSGISTSTAVANSSSSVADRGRLQVRLLPVPLQKAKSVHGFYSSQHDSSMNASGDHNSNSSVFTSGDGTGTMSHTNSGSTVSTRECNSHSPCSYSSRRSAALHTRSSTAGGNSNGATNQDPHSSSSSSSGKHSPTAKLPAVRVLKGRWRSADRCSIA